MGRRVPLAARRAVSSRAACVVVGLLATVAVLPQPTRASEPSVAPLLNLFKSGRVPAERQGTLVELICKRGDAEDLGTIYAKAVDPAGFSPELRANVLDWLADAAFARNVRPAGDLSSLKVLLAAPAGGAPGTLDPKLRLRAVRLAGRWKVEALADSLKQAALDPQSPSDVRQAALAALGEIGGKTGRGTIETLAGKDQPRGVRTLAVAALADIDPRAAAPLAVEVLAGGSEQEDPAALLTPFLARRPAEGTDLLAAAVRAQPVSADVAKRLLRHLYGVGRSDPALVEALGTLAGVQEELKLTPAQVQELAAEVLAKGDPKRGEAVFRRGDLSCMKCHAVSRAGGNVGPDLSPVGANSPVDYLVNSIVEPNLAVKEQFLATVVTTVAGKVHTGIVVDRTPDRIVLRDAAGNDVAVPVKDIDDQAPAGSLMPKGLTKFLTRSELVDLVRFLHELGRPGEWEIRRTPRVQRWRVLRNVPEGLLGEEPDEEVFEDLVLRAPDEKWAVVYARTNGTLPLDELQAHAGAGGVLWLQGEVDVVEGGAIAFRFDSPDGLRLWIDDHRFEAGQAEIATELERGRRRLTVRVDRQRRAAPDVSLEVRRIDGSKAQFDTVGGR